MRRIVTDVNKWRPMQKGATPEERKRYACLIKEGWGITFIAKELGRSKGFVRAALQTPESPCAPVRPRREFTFEERQEIEKGLIAGEPCGQLSKKLGRLHCVVSREVKRAGGRASYNAARAHDAALAKKARPALVAYQEKNKTKKPPSEPDKKDAYALLREAVAANEAAIKKTEWQASIEERLAALSMQIDIILDVINNSERMKHG